MNKAFSIGEALKFGWETSKKNFWFYAGVFLITVVSSFAGNQLAQIHGFTLLGSILYLLINFLLLRGTIIIALKFVDGQKGQYSDFWMSWDNTPQFLLASILLYFAFIIGFVLLILPGLIAVVSLCLTGYLIVDKKMKGIDAIKESWRMTKGHRWNLFALIAIFVLMTFGVMFIAGILSFATMSILGFAFLPVFSMLFSTISLAMAWVYRKLSGAIVVDEKVAVPMPTPEAPMVPAADV